MAPPVFKTGLAGIALAGRFDSFPPPPFFSARLVRRVHHPGRLATARFPPELLLPAVDLRKCEGVLCFLIMTLRQPNSRETHHCDRSL